MMRNSLTVLEGLGKLEASLDLENLTLASTNQSVCLEDSVLDLSCDWICLKVWMRKDHVESVAIPEAVLEANLWTESGSRELEQQVSSVTLRMNFVKAVIL